MPTSKNTRKNGKVKPMRKKTQDNGLAELREAIGHIRRLIGQVASIAVMARDRELMDHIAEDQREDALNCITVLARDLEAYRNKLDALESQVPKRVTEDELLTLLDLGNELDMLQGEIVNGPVGTSKRLSEIFIDADERRKAAKEPAATETEEPVEQGAGDE